MSKGRSQKRPSPFSPTVLAALLPSRFRMPDMRAFNGNSDPQDHLYDFNNLMDLHQVSDLAKCRCLAVTLIAHAKRWFRLLPAGSEMGETLQSYIDRFIRELYKVAHTPEKSVRTLIIAGVRLHTYLWKELQSENDVSLTRFYNLTEKYPCIESFVAALNRHDLGPSGNSPN
ncbi:uncharacterized protein LOC116110476 [Pistacia vera]|uniref:uncharacterized protein LOC116110476 n=1 Tax=Pistacia vera TaxID=55513 RepID=UPI001263DF53|nr:uncharacterized protein LOC116110476 [Pistacia vera]